MGPDGDASTARIGVSAKTASAERAGKVVNAGRRPLAIWTSVHDNGWVANAVERPDGTFAAWAACDATTEVDYVEDGPENAKLAAEFALRRKSGHAQCSPLCLGWRVHFRELP